MDLTILSKDEVGKWKEADHPAIEDKMAADWQEIADLMARIMDVPSGLIMRLEDDELSIYVSSRTEGNPYHIGDKEEWFGSELYCERVLRTADRLFIPNALEDEAWKENPDVELNMINYLGYPLNWPNGDPFGTICVLDNKTHYYSDDQQAVMVSLKNVIESNLALLTKNLEMEALVQRLDTLARTDTLTGILNRRAFLEQCEKELGRASRHGHGISILMIDLDCFKKINDNSGHAQGDAVLVTFARVVEQMMRGEDVFGRLGGDEFGILLPHADTTSAREFAERVRAKVASTQVVGERGETGFTVSIGMAQYHNEERGLAYLISVADEALYNAKAAGRNRVWFEK